MEYTKGDRVLKEHDCGCLIFERHSIMFNETQMDIHYCPKHNAAPAMYEALEKISEGKGAFSLDHLTHAENTIESMKNTAIEALALARRE